MTATHPAAGSATSDASPQATAARTRRRRLRAGAVGGAVLANVLLWLIADGFGVDFVLSDSAGTAVINLVTVIIFTAAFALLGWGTLALLEHFTRRARTVWTWLAIAVLALSMVPIFLEQATTGTRIALVLIHLAVAAVLIPALRAHGRQPARR